MKTKRSKRRRTAGSLKRVVLLRRYLEDNILEMERYEKNAGRHDGGKRYWREGARKMRAHLETVKAIELEAQENDQAETRRATDV